MTEVKKQSKVNERNLTYWLKAQKMEIRAQEMDMSICGGLLLSCFIL